MPSGAKAQSFSSWLRDIDELVAARPDFGGSITLQFEAGRLIRWAAADAGGDALLTEDEKQKRARDVDRAIALTDAFCPGYFEDGKR